MPGAMATSCASWTGGTAVFAASRVHDNTRVRTASSSGRACAHTSARPRLTNARRNVVRTAAADPTAVPRAEGVQDGEWNALDERLVRESQGDAEVTFERSTSMKNIERLLSGDGTRKPGVDPSYNLLGMTLPELKTFAEEAGPVSYTHLTLPTTPYV